MRQILFEIPGLGVKIFGYGLMLFFAFLGSMNLAAWRARREKLDPEAVYDLALYVFLGGLVGVLLMVGLYLEMGNNARPDWKVALAWIIFIGSPLLFAFLGGYVGYRLRRGKPAPPREG